MYSNRQPARGRIVQQLREAEGRVYHKGRRQSSGQKTRVALLFRQPITMERKQRGFWANGGAQVRRPVPHMAHNYMAVWTHKRSRGKRNGRFYCEGKGEKSAKSSMKTEKEKQPKVWAKAENMRCRRRRW